jgi:hypothetical protein
MHLKLNLSGHPNEKLSEMGYLYLGALHVDLADVDLPNKILDWLKPYLDNADTVTICPPGLAPLSLIMVTVIHGATGHFPKLMSLVKTEEGFVPNENIIDLQNLRNEIARKERKDVVML